MEPQIAREAPGAMDRRAGRRVAVDCPALVLRRGVPVMSGRVTNLGMCGLFLDVGAPMLPRHSCIEVGVSLHCCGSGFLRLPAMVVRTEPAGMGLIFDPELSDCEFLLRNLVQHGVAPKIRRQLS